MASAAIRNIREEIKQYIDHADPRIVKMIHAMLEVDSDADWWHSMPDNIQTDVADALAQADKGEFIAHEQLKKKYPKWFTK